jgi:peptide/nickel transport system substrate-binding protein
LIDEFNHANVYEEVSLEKSDLNRDVLEGSKPITRQLEEKMKKLGYLICVFIIAMLMILPACTPSTPEATTAPAVTGEIPANTAVPQETPTLSEADKVGGTFVVAIPTEPDTLDCQKSGLGATNTVCRFFGGALVANDPNTAGVYVPYLAESWEISADGLTHTFHLKPGIRFHDGSLLTAQDFVYSLNRLMNPDTGAPSAGAMDGITSIEAPDDATLVIHSSSPMPFLLDFLTSTGYTMPYSENYMTTNGEDYFAAHPMGVGPYIFQEYLTGSKVVLTRNPDYTWGPTYSNGSPYNFDTVEIRVLPEESTTIAGMETGEINYNSDISANNIAQYEPLSNLVVREVPSYTVSGIFMNPINKFLSDVRVRQAINYAIDKDSIVNLIFQGRALPAYSSLSATTPGYDPAAETTGYHYDVAKAKNLLEEAGFVMGTDGIYEKDGEPLHFTINTEGTAESKTKLAEVVQQQLKAAGIDIEIQQLDEGVSVQNWATGQYDLQLLSYEWGNAEVLMLIFHSQAFGGGIWGGFDNNGLDAMIENIRTIVDKQEWTANVYAVQQKIITDALFAPIYTPFVFTAMTNNVVDAIPEFWDGWALDTAYFAK